ncbi:MAG: hypothetical protein Q4C60_11945 [Eubacteriales bacterium]|nr:hypothetical protein [Eubacteriales bacterium]
MVLEQTELGRVEIRDIPLEGLGNDASGTYTASGRVLVSDRLSEAEWGKDFFDVYTVRDDGTNRRQIFRGRIPQLPKANGIRWMCAPDNRRILLGDYVMECSPDVDDCRESALIPLRYPEQIREAPDVFCRWSEIIIAPDNETMCWTTLGFSGAVNYLGRLVREADVYMLEKVCTVSSGMAYEPDPAHEGCVREKEMHGGEVKQFVCGGRALALVGNGESNTESVVQPLTVPEKSRVAREQESGDPSLLWRLIEERENPGDDLQITDTPGYEETTIFSPDETLGVVMSPRFSLRTNCGVFGLVPQPHSMLTRGGLINTLYMYCVAGVRSFRPGHIGPVLIDVARSVREGRAYQGVDLSDPAGEWVYYSPMSWHPDSTRAMWVERTRPSAGAVRSRLRMCRLEDREAGHPVPAAAVPEPSQIPYAGLLTESQTAAGSENGAGSQAVSGSETGAGSQTAAGQETGAQSGAAQSGVRLMGRAAGVLVSSAERTVYEHFSDDGETFYDGFLSVEAPVSFFAPGRTVVEADLRVTGAHTGEMKLRAVFVRESGASPSRLSFAPDESGQPESRGYASYDGQTLRIEEMEP